MASRNKDGTEVAADITEFFIPVARSQRHTLAVEHEDIDRARLLLDGLERAIEAIHRQRILGMLQDLPHIGLEAQGKGQGFIFLQDRFQVQRRDLQLGGGLVALIALGPAQRDAIGQPADHHGGGQEQGQDQQVSSRAHEG
jgi:hypothetical protein